PVGVLERPRRQTLSSSASEPVFILPSVPPTDTCASSFFFQAEDGIRDGHVTGVQTCALPISFGPVRLQPAVDTAGPGPGRKHLRLRYGFAVARRARFRPAQPRSCPGIGELLLGFLFPG